MKFISLNYMTGVVYSSTFEKVTDICSNQVAPFLSRSRVFEKIIAKSVKNEKQTLVIENFRVLANCSAQLPQSSLQLVCEASLHNYYKTSMALIWYEILLCQIIGEYIDVYSTPCVWLEPPAFQDEILG